LHHEGQSSSFSVPWLSRPLAARGGNWSCPSLFSSYFNSVSIHHSWFHLTTTHLQPQIEDLQDLLP
jgi:hypothetical protein